VDNLWWLDPNERDLRPVEGDACTNNRWRNDPVENWWRRDPRERDLNWSERRLANTLWLAEADRLPASGVSEDNLDSSEWTLSNYRWWVEARERLRLRLRREEDTDRRERRLSKNRLTEERLRDRATRWSEPNLWPEDLDGEANNQRLAQDALRPSALGVGEISLKLPGRSESRWGPQEGTWLASALWRKRDIRLPGEEWEDARWWVEEVDRPSASRVHERWRKNLALSRSLLDDHWWSQPRLRLSAERWSKLLNWAEEENWRNNSRWSQRTLGNPASGVSEMAIRPECEFSCVSNSGGRREIRLRERLWTSDVLDCDIAECACRKNDDRIDEGATCLTSTRISKSNPKNRTLSVSSSSNNRKGQP
jgi:hypothetical protein